MAGGVREAAWPSIRNELGLSYFQIGLLLGLPTLISGIFEPVLGIMSDIRSRRPLVLAGGLLFAASLLLTAGSYGFWLLLVSFVLFYPASGAFVSLSQAELMDRYPDRRDKNMARWTFAGSAGAVVGPLALGAGLSLGTGWRALYLATAAMSAGALVLAARFAFPAAGSARGAPAEEEGLVGLQVGLMEGFRGALRALKRVSVLRWLVLSELANLMLDVLFGFLALYFVEAGGLSAAQAAFGMTVWTASEVAGDLLLIPLLDRLDALKYLRLSAAAVGVLFPCFLLVGPFALKLVLIAMIGLARAGWYAILQARLYESLPGQSGVALALTNVAGLAGGLMPLALGALAQTAGLPAAMWALMAGPLALLVGLPWRRK